MHKKEQIRFTSFEYFALVSAVIVLRRVLPPLPQICLSDWNSPGEVSKIWWADGCFTGGEGEGGWKCWTDLRSKDLFFFPPKLYNSLGRV